MHSIICQNDTYIRPMSELSLDIERFYGVLLYDLIDHKFFLKLKLKHFAWHPPTIYYI